MSTSSLSFWENTQETVELLICEQRKSKLWGELEAPLDHTTFHCLNY